MNHRRAFGMLLGSAISLLPLPGMQAATVPEPVLGRLFFTPQERAALDRQRLTGSTDTGDTVTINGVVKNRTSGRTTVWINGKPWHEAAKLTGVHPASRDAARVAVEAAQGRPLAVPVGESANRLTGETRGSLAGGRVTVHAPSPVHDQR